MSGCITLDFSLNEYDEIQLEEVSSSDRGEEKVKKRSGKKKMLRGLTSVAEEAGSVFIKVAVSEAKLKIGKDQKEVRGIIVCSVSFSLSPSLSFSKSLMNSFSSILFFIQTSQQNLKSFRSSLILILLKPPTSTPYRIN